MVEEKANIRLMAKTTEVKKVANSPAPVQSVETVKTPEPEKPKDSLPRQSSSSSISQNRLAWKVTDGKLDPDGFREGTSKDAKEIFQKSLRDPDFRKWAGLDGTESAQSAALALTVTPATVGFALDAVSSCMAYFLASRTGLQYKEVCEILAWSEREHAQLDPMGAQLASKYVPPEWMKYTDVIMFVTTLGVLLRGKASQVEKKAQQILKEIQNPPAEQQETQAKAPEAPKNPPPAPVDLGLAKFSGTPADSIAPSDREDGLKKFGGDKQN